MWVVVYIHPTTIKTLVDKTTLCLIQRLVNTIVKINKLKLKLKNI